MSGVRIYELARELGVANKVLIDLLAGMGYPVKSHSSSVDLHLADRLRRQVDKSGIPRKKPKKAKKTEAAKTVEKTKPAAKAKPTAKVKTAAKPKSSPTAKPAAKAKTAEKPVAKEAQEKEPQAKTAPKPAPRPATEAKPASPRKASARPPARVAEPARPKQEKAVRHVSDEERRKEREKRRKEEEKRRQDEARRRQEARKRQEEDAKLKKERAAKRRKDDEERRKKEAEERELQRLIDEEERIKNEIEAKKIIIDEATTVKEFAETLRLGVNDIIVKLMGKGIMATLNQTIDVDVAKELALELGYEIKTREEKEQEAEEVEEEDKEALEYRPPVVTIMGHVDHGKTSLLDTIRKTRVTEEEAGGITQRIGAYKVEMQKGVVVFLDTPGHEAFTAMRARGASVTDIVVLVVAADDGVMPQTLEAIHHAKAANVPVLVAINKIDKPGSNPDRIRQELSAHDLVPEDWGGQTIFCEVSAKAGTGIDNLLEMLLLQSEMLELKANPKRLAYGYIIESKLDKGRGPVATVLVQKGSLHVGDAFVTGSHFGKVRALIDDKGKRVDSAGPSMPVEVLGFSGVPAAGESFMVCETERKAHQIAMKRKESERVEGLTAKGHVKLENLHAQITKGDIKDLNIIVKADVQGSIEAVRQSMGDTQIENIRINILHGGVGGITESDISLAAASNAIIIGFNVRPTEKARSLALEEEVDVRLYSVIYNAIDDIKSALEGMLEPVFREVVTGRADVRETFHITKIGTIAGCKVASGKITRNSQARLIRDNVVIHTGKIESLKRFKDDAKEVLSGYECGIGLENYNDVKVQDVIETFVEEEIERKSA